MRPIRRILVAVKDPKARSLPAVAKAAQLAQAFGAELELFHSISSPVYVDPLAGDSLDLAGLERDQKKEYNAQLEKVAERVRRHDVTVTCCTEWDYPVYEAIVRRAAKTRADLIVAERHAGKHAMAWLLSFTDWELIRLAPVPVLIVKTPKPYHRPRVLAAVDPSHAYSKPAKLDDEILDAAGALKEALRGKVDVMHSFMPMPLIVAPIPGDDAAIAARVEAAASRQARQAFDALLKSSPVPRGNRHLVEGHPMDVIPGKAKELKASIAVMGAISRSGLKRVFIGNTAERVLDSLPCDVLVVKPANVVPKVPRARRGIQWISPPIAP